MATSTSTQPELMQVPTSSAICVNPRCVIQEEDGMRVVVYAGLPVFHYHQSDWAAEAVFIAQAQESKIARGTELATALGKSVRTTYRMRQRYLEEGAGGLVPKKPGPKGPRLGTTRETAIRRWYLEGQTVYRMAQRLKVSPHTVKSALIRMGLSPQRDVADQAELWASLEKPSVAEADAVVSDEQGAAALDAPVKIMEGGVDDDQVLCEAEHTVNGDADLEMVSEVLPAQMCRESEGDTGLEGGSTLDSDPNNRSIDRQLAAAGLLADATPLFARSMAVPGGGVLMALPGLVNSGVFEVAEQVYGNIGPAFYGLRTMLLTMVLMALLRIKRPENVKEYSPSGMGRIIGLDRLPEVKTIRSKLARLTADDGHSERFIDALVRRRVARTGDALGFLYVDGHVRVYHGRYDIPKTHVARMRLSLPAAQDVWVNDANGSPVFFVTQQAHDQLVGALPAVLQQVRQLVEERRVTVVFDRGGWSPRLFEQMDTDGFDVLTYRKGGSVRLPAEAFTTYKVKLPSGTVTYELHDTTITVGDKGFRMRQVTRRRDDHQTQIVTTRHDLPVAEVARRMFDRWRQENFFKYMRQEFAIDALLEYGTEAADANRMVPNPARKDVQRELKTARQELARLEAAYADAAVAAQPRNRPLKAGFEAIYGAALHQPLREARARIEELVARRKALPNGVAIGTIKDDVVRLPMRRKRLSDALKMLAYQVETDMVRAVGEHYARNLDEGRRLIRAGFESAADIEPVGNELRITLAAQSSRHRSVALDCLCQQLNETETCFPGTALRLHYAVRGAEPAT